MKLPKLIDNQRNNLAETLRIIAPNHKHLSIATGYWDIYGTLEIIDSIKDYTSIRLIIGQEPMYSSYLKKMGVSSKLKDIKSIFPDTFIKEDLEDTLDDSEFNDIRETVARISKLVEDGVLEVKVFRKPFLHAKAYIFGDYNDSGSVGIVGSSNFTRAGLTSNAELNSLESDFRVVNYQPQNDKQENGHLSWFDSYWNHEDAQEWTGDFKQTLLDSPVGNLTFGPYDVYIKALMEVYEDEMNPPAELTKETTDILYSFQNRNAGILINKLKRMKLAILSDSVGLGKTITAGAVIKHYLDKNDGKANIQIIAPASLKQQWRDDLASVLDIDYMDGAYNIISQQDINALDKLYEEYDKDWRKTKNIDLFVVDEAHNLRSQKGKRHEVILKLFQQHPDSHILLITATPINNALLDVVNMIQLASKGNIKSIPVSYVRPTGNETERIDFYDAISRIQTQLNKTKTVEEADKILERMKPTIHEGLRHYMVRSTRQGVETEGGIIDKTGQKRSFPISDVESIDYEYSSQIIDFAYEYLLNTIDDVFEGLNPTMVNLSLLSALTQQSMHPLDFVKKIKDDPMFIHEFFAVNDKKTEDLGDLILGQPVKSLIPNILQTIYLLGFTAYRPSIYKNIYYGKSIEEIRSNPNITHSLSTQLTIHNILHVTWLKRLESSPKALLNSIQNYRNRLSLFMKYLDMGYIVTLSDAEILESYYNDGEDIDDAFKDYAKFEKEEEEWLKSGKDINDLKEYGVAKEVADDNVYNLKQLRIDLDRDVAILITLENILKKVSSPKNDIKMHELADHIVETIKSGKYGKKVLVFSFFSDTIHHLKENLSYLISDRINDYQEKSEYITGQTPRSEEIVRRFSPISKKYDLKPNDIELDFLFATDVLSEGQNLQDSGYLINYDLHWNPVRMIQRNGRINRLGSIYERVLIANMKPTNDLEIYLNLVYKLEHKINTIRNTVGLDQGVLTKDDVNPIDFIERYYDKGELPTDEDEFLAHIDEHINELRKFLGENKDQPTAITRIKEMPMGKWNYLPEQTNSKSSVIALSKIEGHTKITKNKFNDIFFVEVDERDNEYIATYIDYVKALDSFRTTIDDNNRRTDNIKFDRNKVYSRIVAEAKRQTNNPETSYEIKPQYMRALTTISNYMEGSIDLLGSVEKGVNKVNVRKELEKILRKVNKEHKDEGVVNLDTINAFMRIFNIIQESHSEEKEIIDSKVLLLSSRV